MSDILLTSLCTICHVKPYKYRCPRCSALTCSLPCISRHKQWAQCNGIRDPTAYIKQKDLATPKGIDHDYNYLTSIERELDNAEKESTSRGIILEANDRKKDKKKGDVQLEAAIERCGVVVVKAPRGMTRSKQNQTAVTKRSKRLQWTVEWVDSEGCKTLGRCLEDQAIAEAYVGHLKALDTHRPKRRKDDHKQTEVSTTDNTTMDNVTKKPQEPPEIDGQELPPHQAGQDRVLEQVKRKRKGGEDGESAIEEGCQAHEKKPKPSSQSEEKLSSENGDLSRLTRTVTSAEHEDGAEIQPSRSPFDTNKSASTHSMTFHLLHPSLPSKYPVLIPLSPDAHLATTLTNRLVLEFPTIYVLPQQQDGGLPAGFISEADFFATTTKGLAEDITGPEASIPSNGAMAHGASEKLEEGEVDEHRLLEVVGKDLKGLDALQ